MKTPTPSPRKLHLTLAAGAVLAIAGIAAVDAPAPRTSEEPTAAVNVPRPTQDPSVSVALTVPTPDVAIVAPPATTEPEPIETDTPPTSVASPPPPPSDPPVVILYGDSLAYSAKEFFEWEVRSKGWEPVLRVYPGSATCDWFDELEPDLVAHAPAMVVVAFSGNAMTTCMVDPLTGAGYTGDRHTEKYRSDTTHMARTVIDAGAIPVIVSAPAAAHGGGASLPAVFLDVVAMTPGSLYVDGGATIAPDGVYTPTMPCRPDEGADLGCIDGIIRVRADDGAHFCPDEPHDVYGNCPVYASGARRYAELLASHPWVARDGIEPRTAER